MRAKIILGADSQECLSELCQLTDSFAAATQNHHHYDDSKFNDEDDSKFNDEDESKFNALWVKSGNRGNLKC